MLPLERLVVGVIAEAVEKGSYLHTLFCLFGQYAEEKAGDGVVAEIEIFQVDATAGLPYGGKHVVEFFLPVHKQHDAVVVRECHTFLAKLVYYQAVAALAPCHELQKKEQGCQRMALYVRIHVVCHHIMQR